MNHTTYKNTILARVDTFYTYAELTAAFPYRTMKQSSISALNAELDQHICYL